MAIDSTYTYRGRARLSSSRSEGLFDGIFARGAAAAATSDDAWLQAMLDVEASLACVSADLGLIARQDADAIAAAARAELYDAAELGAAAVAGGNPVIGLVAAMRERVGPDAAAHVHAGATSQDVLDTAAVLLARAAVAAISEDAAAIAARCAELASEHATTPMLARTLLQPAMASTFGLKAAGWHDGVKEALSALEAARAGLTVQLGGPAGTLDGFDGRGVEVADALAKALGLPPQRRPWHGNRVRIARLGAALALTSGAVAKLARDVTLLAQGEVGEAREAGGEGHGGSSSMAHKHNPLAAVATIACAQQLPGLAATLLAAIPGEHERAAGSWHAEWPALRSALRLTGSAVSWARAMLATLELDTARMAANLAAAQERDGVPRGAGLAARLAAAPLEEPRT